LTISASVVDNQQGKIQSQTESHLNVEQSLDNRQGDVTGQGSVAINGKTLHINNQDGRLQGGSSLSIFADEVTTNGHIEGNDIQITQQKDFVTGNHINAGHSLEITTAGNFTNQHHLYADERVTLKANNIENRIDGRISSANTLVDATGNLTNEGLINGISPSDNAKTVVKAGGRLLNTGKGRIYGDDVALQADTIINSDKDYGNNEIKSAVVAARGRLDIAAREIENNTAHYLSDNQVGSTLFSVGEMTFGRVLNAENHAEGKAEALRNNSSVIESESHIYLNINQVQNNNTHLKVHHVVNGQQGDDITRVKGSEKTLNEEYIIPEHGQKLPSVFQNSEKDEKGVLASENNPYIPMKNLIWAGWSRAGQLVYNLKTMEPTVLKAGDNIQPDMLLASRNEMDCDSYGEGKRNCTYILAGNYGLDSPIWAYANATVPTEPSPVFSFDELTAYGYTEEEWFKFDPKTGGLDLFVIPEEPKVAPKKPVRLTTETDDAFQARLAQYDKELATHNKVQQKWNLYISKIKPYNDWVKKNEEAIEAVDKKIDEHNQALRTKLGQAYYRDFWVIKLKQSQEDQSKITQTVPGQILSGGKITFDGQSLTNDRSHVIAGQTLNLAGRINNEDQEGLHRLTESGTSQYTNDRWRGGFKRYFQRDWHHINDYKRIIETPITLGINRLEENADYTAYKHSNNLKTKTEHELNLTSVMANSHALSALGAENLGNIQGGDNAIFDELSSSIASQTQINAPSTSATRQLERIVLNDKIEVRTIQPNLVVPQNVLYRVNAEPNSRVLIETDPDFTNQKRWLSSDYMFNALRYEPNQTQKRLGDGFYEQRLVREQINRLTGRNFVGHYTDFDSQYRGLMDAGVTFAEKFNLRPGIALSPSQVAQLTSDIVWFESQSVTLPNGTVAQVLAPKVYALAKQGDITGNGTLLSGNKVIHSGGEFINSGTVAGRELVQLDSDSIRNTGTISGGAIVGNVNGNVENIGGTIEADRAILLNVAGNFTHSSTTHTTHVNENGYQRTDTTLGRQGLLHVKGEDGVLQLNANNIDVTGASIINDGQGGTYLSARNNMNFNALNVGFDEKMGGGNHYRNEA
ncbi:heme utilization protein, partial [Pasteurellaceae bacterium 15-036681]